jgi:hypothetical protein
MTGGLIKMSKFLKINCKDDKKIRKVKKNTVNKYMARHTTRSIYDLSVRTEVGRKSTTRQRHSSGG